MTISIDKSIDPHVRFEHFSSPANGVQPFGKMTREIRGLITPMVLAIYGVMANAMFWYGLLAPYNPHTRPEGGYLHALFTLIGVAMALGGALAIIMIDRQHGPGALRRLDYMGGVLNLIVLTAAFVLVASAFLFRV